MQHIGDIMQEMRLTVPLAPPSRLLSALKSHLQEYSCSRLREEDYAEEDNPWDEWPYSWVCQLNDFARERFHSFHQNQNEVSAEQTPAAADGVYSADEYSQVAARAA